jgi:hypothetical protein
MEQVAAPIERAVLNGQLSTIVTAAYKPDVAQELEAAGYAVTHHTDPRNKESWYTIK